MKFSLFKFVRQKEKVKTIADYQKDLILVTGKNQLKKLDELGLIFQMFQMRLR